VRERLGLSRRAEPILRRLEHAAETINPFLIMIVLGLGVVDTSCYVALEIGRLQTRSHGLSQIAVPGPTFGQIAASGLPGN
jgi:hypothetical protein